jgi:membrane protein CcdC involved in cytochrome C biogenesis
VKQTETVLITVAIVAVVLVFRIMRMRREQRFGVMTMWIVPALFALLAIGVVIFDRVTTPLDMVLVLLALAVGAAIGWYQGTHTTIRVDRKAQAAYVRVSPIGIAIFVGVLVLRIAIRTTYAGPPPGTPGAPPGSSALNLVSVILLFVVVGMIGGLRAYITRAYHSAPLVSAE